jgi:deoxyribodipyrimidine photolyase-related protein
MYTGDAFLFHSRLSFSLNNKMLSPLEVVEKVERYWFANQDRINIAQVEGFIRQIIGWREYMRGVYWAKMPEYATLNFFGHNRKLPEFYWSGKTKMNCLKHSIGQSLEKSYAHHIQRLMVTGNFALLAGIHPDEVDQWYLGIYIDAIEWVEITNTRGMSQFADGGIVGTKPYVSSANYIDKMSDYCKGCHYDKSLKIGEKACPFNSLYWHFYHRNEDKLAKNPRIGMAYRTLEKMKDKSKILDQAEKYLGNLEGL